MYSNTKAALPRGSQAAGMRQLFVYKKNLEFDSSQTYYLNVFQLQIRIAKRQLEWDSCLFAKKRKKLNLTVLILGCERCSCTIWKSKNPSAIQILREINFCKASFMTFCQGEDISPIRFWRPKQMVFRLLFQRHSYYLHWGKFRHFNVHKFTN